MKDIIQTVFNFFQKELPDFVIYWLLALNTAVFVFHPFNYISYIHLFAFLLAFVSTCFALIACKRYSNLFENISLGEPSTLKITNDRWLYWVMVRNISIANILLLNLIAISPYYSITFLNYFSCFTLLIAANFYECFQYLMRSQKLAKGFTIFGNRSQLTTQNTQIITIINKDPYKLIYDNVCKLSANNMQDFKSLIDLIHQLIEQNAIRIGDVPDILTYCIKDPFFRNCLTKKSVATDTYVSRLNKILSMVPECNASESSQIESSQWIYIFQCYLSRRNSQRREFLDLINLNLLPQDPIILEWLKGYFYNIYENSIIAHQFSDSKWQQITNEQKTVILLHLAKESSSHVYQSNRDALFVLYSFKNTTHLSFDDILKFYECIKLILENKKELLTSFISDYYSYFKRDGQNINPSHVVAIKNLFCSDLDASNIDSIISNLFIKNSIQDVSIGTGVDDNVITINEQYDELRLVSYHIIFSIIHETDFVEHYIEETKLHNVYFRWIQLYKQPASDHTYNIFFTYLSQDDTGHSNLNQICTYFYQQSNEPFWKLFVDYFSDNQQLSLDLCSQLLSHFDCSKKREILVDQFLHNQVILNHILNGDIKDLCVFLKSSHYVALNYITSNDSITEERYCSLVKSLLSDTVDKYNDLKTFISKIDQSLINKFYTKLTDTEKKTLAQFNTVADNIFKQSNLLVLINSVQLNMVASLYSNLTIYISDLKQILGHQNVIFNDEASRIQFIEHVCLLSYNRSIPIEYLDVLPADRKEMWLPKLKVETIIDARHVIEYITLHQLESSFSKSLDAQSLFARCYYILNNAPKALDHTLSALSLTSGMVRNNVLKNIPDEIFDNATPTQIHQFLFSCQKIVNVKDHGILWNIYLKRTNLCQIIDKEEQIVFLHKIDMSQLNDRNQQKLLKWLDSNYQKQNCQILCRKLLNNIPDSYNHGTLLKEQLSKIQKKKKNKVFTRFRK